MKEKLTRRTFLTASALGAAALVLPHGMAFGSPTDTEIQELYQRYIDNQGEYAAGKQLLEEAIAAKNGMSLLAAPDLEAAVNWAIAVANNNTIGYEWGGWGPEYDCGHLVLAALQVGGFAIGGATYTGNMRSALSGQGWQVLSNFDDLRRGDILLNDVNHAALHVGGGQLVEASWDYDGLPGDSSGNEIAVRPYYWYPWNCVLRWPAAPYVSDYYLAQLYTAMNSEQQQFRLINHSDGTFSIKNDLTGYALDISGGNASQGVRLEFWGYTGNDNQRFYLQPDASVSYQPAGSAPFHIIPKLNQGLRVNASGGGHNNEDAIILWPKTGGEYFSDDLWVIADHSNGIRNLMVVSSLKAMDVRMYP